MLDAQALTLAAALHPSVRPWLQRAYELDADLVICAVTIAEVVRGVGRDAGVHRVLKAATTVPVDSGVARTAGELLGKAHRDDTVDALVVATAMHEGDRVGATRRVILTSDEGDLQALADHADRPIAVVHC